MKLPANTILLPLLALITGLGITAGVWKSGEENSRQRLKYLFEYRAEEITLKIESRMHNYEQMLEDLAGLVRLHPEISESEFRDYVQNLHLDSRFPGTQGIGFTRYLRTDELSAYLARQKKIKPDFNFRPAGERESYAPVQYLEPPTPANSKVIGFDLLAEPIRHQSMSRALAERRTVASGRLTLVQDAQSPGKAGVLIATPVFLFNGSANVSAEAEPKMWGFVAAPLRIIDVLSGVLSQSEGSQNALIRITIADTDDLTNGKLLFDSASTPTDSAAQFQTERHIGIAGRVWRVRYQAEPGFSALTDSTGHYFLLPIGFLASILSATVIWLLLNGRDKAMRLANKMTESFQHSEARLRAESKRNQTLLRNASDGIHILDSEGRLIEASDAFCKMLGASREDLVGKHVSHWDRFLEPEQLQLALQNQLNSKQLQVFQTVHTRKDGSLLNVEITGVAVEIDGRLAIFNSSRDITDRLRIERQLKLFESLVETIGDPVYVLDPAQNFKNIYVNQAACLHFGLEREQLLQMHVMDWDVAMQSETDMVQLWKKLRQDKVMLFESVQRVGADRLVPVEILANYLLYDDTEYIGGTFRNVSERKRQQEELIAAKNAAEAANAAKSEFLAVMSHEIRTPMNGIIGMTDLLDSEELTATQREYLHAVKSSANALLAIIDEILDFSKIEAGMLGIEKTPFEIRALINEIASLFNARARQKGLDFSWTIDAACPETIISDHFRLRQVLINLLGNALKFTGHGKLSLEVKVESIAGDHASAQLHFSVQDSGIGIPADRIQTIFQPFTQVDASTTRRYGGTGLGLSITERLVGLLGGRIWVESELDKGSVFHFCIPLVLASEAAQLSEAVPVNALAAPRASALPTQLTAGTGSVATTPEQPILLVEDHPLNQKLAMTMLQKWGYHVELAENGQQAVDLYRERKFALILMDMQMPVMDGVEATLEIRRLERARASERIAIIAMTANARKEDEAHCLGAGMDDFLSKPINAASFQAKVNLWLGQRTPQ